MSRPVPDHDRDREQRDVAVSLTRYHAPYWSVMWLPYHRAWTAFYLGPAQVAPLRHTDPHQLSQQMRSTPWTTPTAPR